MLILAAEDGARMQAEQQQRIQLQDIESCKQPCTLRQFLDIPNNKTFSELFVYCIQNAHTKIALTRTTCQIIMKMYRM